MSGSMLPLEIHSGGPIRCQLPGWLTYTYTAHQVPHPIMVQRATKRNAASVHTPAFAIEPRVCHTLPSPPLPPKNSTLIGPCGGPLSEIPEMWLEEHAPSYAACPAQFRPCPKSQRKLSSSLGPGGGIPRFNRPLEAVELPQSLRSLAFGDRFNQPLEHATWKKKLGASSASSPSSSFCCFFYPPPPPWLLVLLPHLLPCPSVFCRSLRFGSPPWRVCCEVRLPGRLEHLVFGGKFNRSLDQVGKRVAQTYQVPDSDKRRVFRFLKCIVMFPCWF